jgi:triphosphoribosyl-dephospho-CoA synthase
MTVLLAATRRPPSELPSARIATAAVDALIAEAVLTPKPGLVDRRGNHTHPDMSVGLLEASAGSLHPFFAQCADAARELPMGLELRARLGSVGRAGERHMLAGTAGVNTHRGALWALGLLAAGAAVSESVDEATAFAGRLALLPDLGFTGRPLSNGGRVRMRYGAGGAPAEAAAGFPHVVDVGLPELLASRRRGEPQDAAALNGLLAIMASLDDTCVLHRGGPTALAFVQRCAAEVLAAGGCGTVKGRRRLERFCAESDLRMLSMGGSADLLAATMFVDLLWSGA